MDPEIIGIIEAVVQALAPVIAQVVAKVANGEPDPYQGLLHESVAVTLPLPLASRKALDEVTAGT